MKNGKKGEESSPAQSGGGEKDCRAAKIFDRSGGAMMSKEKIRVGINGFGRIGRCVFKQCIAREEFTVAGINDLAEIEDLAYLLKHDSIHGWYPKTVSNDSTTIWVDDLRIPFFSSRDPAKIPWKEKGADIVIESSGALRSRAKASGHLEGGARRVIISAPSDDVDATIVLGVNEETYDPRAHKVVSMASCTTNSLAPVAKVLHESFGVDNIIFTTVHAYTSSQSLMDIPARHKRRGRAAALSIIPTTTGAAKATEKVLPALQGKISGMAMRVPVPDGSVTDLVANLKKDATPATINEALKQASEKPPLQGILRVTEAELVSRDIQGDPHSSVVDAPSTMVMQKRIAKILAWYDNEWGYSCRLVDFAKLIADRGL
jgi:glyceraldehyde 3-phosphate dehydrogenase